MSTSASWIPVQIAARQGFFEQNGIEVDIQVLGSAPDTVKALVAGELDFGALAVERSIQATQQGKTVVSVVAIQNNPPSAVLVPVDSTLRPGDFAALKGKTIGVVLGGWSEVVMRVMLKRAGVEWSEVNPLSTPNPTTMLSALKGKQVEALSAIEPSQSRAILEGVGRMFFDLQDPTTLALHWPQPFVSTTLQTTATYAQANPEVIAAVIKSVRQGLQYVHTNVDKVIDEWAAANPDVAREVWSLTITRLLATWSKDGEITPAALKNVQEMLVQYGSLEKASPYEEVVYRRN
jgi:NitT/TauT family transport system substrate-binding protein